VKWEGKSSPKSTRKETKKNFNREWTQRGKAAIKRSFGRMDASGFTTPHPQSLSPLRREGGQKAPPEKPSVMRVRNPREK